MSTLAVTKKEQTLEESLEDHRATLARSDQRFLEDLDIAAHTSYSAEVRVQALEDLTSSRLPIVYSILSHVAQHADIEELRTAAAKLIESTYQELDRRFKDVPEGQRALVMKIITPGEERDRLTALAELEQKGDAPVVYFLEMAVSDPYSEKLALRAEEVLKLFGRNVDGLNTPGNFYQVAGNRLYGELEWQEAINAFLAGVEGKGERADLFKLRPKLLFSGIQLNRGQDGFYSYKVLPEPWQHAADFEGTPRSQ